MTSNIGSKRILDLVQKHEQGQGKSTADKSQSSAIPKNSTGTVEYSPDHLQRIEYNKLARVVKRELENVVRPEFLDRIDDIVVFHPLTANELSLIALIMVVEITARAKLEKDLNISVSPELLETMVQEGSGAANQFGARPMRRAIQRILEDAISEAVVRSFLIDGDTATFGKKQVDGTSSKRGGAESLIVTVERERDGEILEILIDESSRDLVSSSAAEDEDWEEEDVTSNGQGENEYVMLDAPPL